MTNFSLKNVFILVINLILATKQVSSSFFIHTFHVNRCFLRQNVAAGSELSGLIAHSIFL